VAIEAVNKKDAKTAETLDKVVLVGGDILSGHVQNDDFIFVTPYARLTLNRKDIKRIETDGSKRVIELIAGDRLTGTIQDAELKIDLKVGGHVVLKMAEVEKVTFGR
jgi:hypothetical protein